MGIKVEILKNVNGVLLLDNSEIIIDKAILPEKGDRVFSYIKYEEIKLEDKDLNIDIEGILIKIDNKEYINEIYDILCNRRDNDFYQIFFELNQLFMFRREVTMEAFRGYVGEMLFIKNIGGRRSPNNSDTFDIFNDGKQVEMKTYSKQQKTITISHEQLTQGSDIYVVPLIKDNDGLDIIELADMINDANFAKEIKAKFENSIFKNYKFRDVKPEPLSWLPKVSELPDGIKSAKYTMNIEEPK